MRSLTANLLLLLLAAPWVSGLLCRTDAGIKSTNADGDPCIYCLIIKSSMGPFVDCVKPKAQYRTALKYCQSQEGSATLKNFMDEIKQKQKLIFEIGYDRKSCCGTHLCNIEKGSESEIYGQLSEQLDSLSEADKVQVRDYISQTLASTAGMSQEEKSQLQSLLQDYGGVNSAASISFSFLLIAAGTLAAHFGVLCGNI